MLICNKAKTFKLYSEGLKRGCDSPSRMGKRRVETDESWHYLIAKCSSIQKIPGTGLKLTNHRVILVAC